MDDINCLGPAGNALLQIFNIDFGGPKNPIWDNAQAALNQGIDFRSAIVGWHKDLVSRCEAEETHRLPDGAAAQVGETRSNSIERRHTFQSGPLSQQEPQTTTHRPAVVLQVARRHYLI